MLITALAGFHGLVALGMAASIAPAVLAAAPVTDYRVELQRPAPALAAWASATDAPEAFERAVTADAGPAAWRSVACRRVDGGPATATPAAIAAPSTSAPSTPPLVLACRVTYTGLLAAQRPEAGTWIGALSDGPGWRLQVTKPLLWPEDGMAQAWFAALLHLVLASALLLAGRRDVAAAWGQPGPALRTSLRRGWLALPIALGLVAAWGLSALGVSPGAPTPALEGAALAVFLASALLLAPLVEEAFFRGWMPDALARHAPRWLATALAANAFALIHLPASAAMWAYYVAVGLALSWLRHRSGSLAPPMLAHALFNALALGLMPG